MKLLLTRLILLSLPILVKCYKILGVIPHPGKSHGYVISPLMKELSRRGHEITFLSFYPTGEELPRYKEFNLKNSTPVLEDTFELSLPNNVFELRKDMYSNVVVITSISDQVCEEALSSEVVQNILKSDEHFDLIIYEPFNTDCMLVLNEKFKAPVVGISTSVILPWNNERLGNIDNPSYIPEYSLDNSDRMDFLHRIENTLVNMFEIYWYDMHRNEQDKIVKKILGDGYPSLNSLGKNMSLMLVNSHFSLTLARPFTPNVIEIGGIHITKPKKLPKNIEKFINESTHGVIYFSLGSMIKGHTFPQEKREEFLKAFARLPQRVLWKWENETMPGKPDNVMIQKWMPQFDILSHPNVKAFISHGGLLGTTEAVHCGVPMLVMPQYGDQHTNAKAVEANGGGVILYLQEATEEKVYQKLKTILDPEFKKKAEALSERFKDRPMSPMDTAVYWVEYVARHKGAPHLRTAAVDMPLYQYLLLDVFAFLALVIFVLLYLIYKIASILVRAILPKKKLKQN